jgi:hypothetical protein
MKTKSIFIETCYNLVTDNFIGENMADYLTAATTREYAQNTKALEGAYLKRETIELLNQVTEAAKRGGDSFVWKGKLCGNEVIHARLRELGYKIFYEPAEYNRESYLQVSW